MVLTRREFGKDTAAIILGGALVVPAVTSATGAELPKKEGTRMTDACNFSSSFMTWDFPYRKDTRPHARHNIPHGNLARIDLDALIDVVEEDGKSERFVLIAPCRTEWVYAKDRLFQIPSAEYRNIYSLTAERSQRQSLTDDGKRSKGGPVSKNFRSLKIDVTTYTRTRVLKTPAEIVKATADNLPLNGRTEIRDPDSKRRFVLEYPIRTMNFQPKTNSFQVDTGPVLVPDFKFKAEKSIDRLEMAFVAYNRLDKAEFLIRRPTPVTDTTGKELCKVLHYSESRELSATTQILAGIETR